MRRSSAAWKQLAPPSASMRAEEGRRYIWLRLPPPFWTTPLPPDPYHAKLLVLGVSRRSPPEGPGEFMGQRADADASGGARRW